MLELVDGIVATGETACRPGRSDSQFPDSVIDPMLLEESERQRSMSTPFESSEVGNTSRRESDEVGLS